MGRLFMKFFSPSFVSGESPSKTSSTVYNLLNTPAAPASVTLISDSRVLTQGVDYTISGTTITLTNALATGQDLFANYTKAR